MARLFILQILGQIVFLLLKFIISQVIAALVIPPAVLIYILNHLLIRSCLKIYLRVRFRGKLKLVGDSGDAMFGYKSVGNNRNILIVLECKKFTHVQHRLDYATKLLDLKVGSIKPYDKLRWIFTKHAGYFCWKYDENFDLDNHLMDMPSEEVVDHEKLIQIVQEYSHDMSEEHPQWQFLCVPNYRNEDGEDASAIVIRFHHGILDGLSFVTFVSHCLGAIAPDSDDEPFTEACPETFPYVLNPLKFFIPLKYRIIYNINCILFGFYHLLRTVMSARKHWNLIEKYPGKSKSYALSNKIELTTLKVIRESCRVSVTSILACAFAQALENTVGSRLPPNELLVGNSLAILPYPDGYFHNRFTLMTVPFKRSNKTTRLEKLKEYHRQSIQAMQGPEYSLYYWFFQFYGKLPSALFQYPLKKPRFSFLLNNLPFAKKQVTIWNQRALKVIGWPPYTTDGGIGLTSVGYCDCIRVGGTADSSWLTKEELKNALKEMVNEVNLLAWECSLNSVEVNK